MKQINQREREGDRERKREKKDRAKCGDETMAKVLFRKRDT